MLVLIHMTFVKSKLSRKTKQTASYINFHKEIHLNLKNLLLVVKLDFHKNWEQIRVPELKLPRVWIKSRSLMVNIVYFFVAEIWSIWTERQTNFIDFSTWIFRPITLSFRKWNNHRSTDAIEVCLFVYMPKMKFA